MMRLVDRQGKLSAEISKAITLIESEMYKRLNIRRQPPAPAVKSRRAEPIVQVPRPLLKRKNALFDRKEEQLWVG